MIKQVLVVGAGQMGAGIAQVAALGGRQVVLTDLADGALQRGRGQIDRSLERMVKKETISAADAAAALARLTFSAE
ncbi:MAG: 3-hydroxyacyl-CoA dehydrogenase NAD-binding domain-containing protein, partial [Sulfobacillus sp.]